MMHTGPGTLQALLDGELDPALRAEAEQHLASCAACAAELDQMRALRDRFRFALRAADVAPSVERAHAAVAARRAAAPTVLRGTRRALARAAVLVMAAAGAAYAVVPGSPVRRWLGVDSPPALAPAEPRLGAAPPVAPIRDEAPAAGVFISPEEGRVRVVVSASSPGLRVRTRFTGAAVAEVRAAGEAAGARFRTGPGRVEVVGAGPGEVTVELPRAARTAVVEVNGRVYLAREDGRTRVLGPVEGREEDDVLFRATP